MEDTVGLLHSWAPLRFVAATDKIGNINETHKPICVNCLQRERAGRTRLQLASVIISTGKDQLETEVVVCGYLSGISPYVNLAEQLIAEKDGDEGRREK